MNKKIYNVSYNYSTYSTNSDKISSVFLKDISKSNIVIYKVDNLDETFVIDYETEILESCIKLKITDHIFTSDFKFKSKTKEIAIIKSDLLLNDYEFIKKYKKDIDFLITKIKETNYVPSIIIRGYYNKTITMDYVISIDNILEFLFFIMKERSPYLEDLFNDEFVQNLSLVCKNPTDDFIKTFLINMTNATFYNAEGFEKILKSNPNIIYNSIGKEILSITNNGKMSNVIQLPKYVVEYVENKNLQHLVPYLQKMDIDGNSYRILIDFLENSSVLVKSSKRSEVYEEFLSNLIEIMSIDNYNIKNLLSHLIKESVYNISQSYYRYQNDIKYKFPLNEVKLMKDYLNMAKRYKTKYKKYPSILVDHNVMMQNTDLVNKINHEEFINAVDKYKNMVDNYTSDKYEILYPTKVMDMINEGNALNHCVASYSFNILDGTSKIFFLRKKDNINEHFVTLEVDSNNNLNHIRTSYNEEPDQGIINSVNIWLNKNK